jgi:hypothetical protein
VPLSPENTIVKKPPPYNFLSLGGLGCWYHGKNSKMGLKNGLNPFKNPNNSKYFK